MIPGKTYPSDTLPSKRRIIIILSLLSILLSGFSRLSAQPVPISGIINTYYHVTEFIPSKACLRLNTTAGLSYNDRVMIIQMKGATINSSNTSAYGDTSSLNDAGNYEISTVCHTDGDSLFLKFMFLNNYSAADNVQVVKIPQYTSAVVTDTLKPLPWDNAAGTGGVLALSVEQDLLLNAPVLADANGYRGGAFLLSGSGCSNFSPATAYYYNGNVSSPSTQNGSLKGEGVSDIAAAQCGGRGAPANGGGGGNNHNNGGGGGANLASGGAGGGNSSTAGCTGSYQGRGGKALSSHAGKKIFAGGGGGAGHANNGIVTSNGGGHGGGIVFIEANNLQGNGFRISSNGQQGGPATSDGASGGGAAGTLILDINNYSGPVTIQANGGMGGSTNDNGNLGRCYGSGGGGSGGAVYFSGASPAVSISVAGGSGGLETGRDASCAAAVPSVSGQPGQVFNNYNYSLSANLASSYCALLLPVDLAWFKARNTKGSARLEWKITDPGSINRFVVERAGDNHQWMSIHEIPAHPDQPFYTHTDPFPPAGQTYYRIRLITNGGGTIYSTVQKLSFQPDDLIRFYPNPAKRNIIISGNIRPGFISLTDLNGRLIMQKNNPLHSQFMALDLPELSPGVYLLQVTDFTGKILIR